MSAPTEGGGLVLIADDQREVRELLADKLRARGKRTESFASGRDLLKQIETDGEDVELVVLDLDFGAGEPDGLEILTQIRAERPNLPVIILTGKGSVDSAVAAVQAGAADFIEKDLFVEDKIELSMEKVERMLQVLRENARLLAENKVLGAENEALGARNEDLGAQNVFYRSELGARYRMVSASPKVEAILQMVEQIASIPRPVLVRGERGTGKELIAAALHYAGTRAEHPFVKLNCAALSESLLESELFGHEKGAFTGASDTRRGRFETADGGTLFLDEIGNTSLEFQQNLLRVLEYQQFERIGGNRTIEVDVRVVAATNTDLEAEIEAGRFRADLYDRLRFTEILLPPLRDRREDIRPLVEYFARELVVEVPSISARPFGNDVLTTMEAYGWPGNVRELKFAVERALCVASGDAITVSDLPPEVGGSSPVGNQATDGTFDEQMTAIEHGILQRSLDGCDGSQKDAAAALGLTYDRFRHILRKHGLTGH